VGSVVEEAEGHQFRLYRATVGGQQALQAERVVPQYRTEQHHRELHAGVRGNGHLMTSSPA
jgi:hypothetical protein